PVPPPKLPMMAEKSLQPSPNCMSCTPHTLLEVQHPGRLRPAPMIDCAGQEGSAVPGERSMQMAAPPPGPPKPMPEIDAPHPLAGVQHGATARPARLAGLHVVEPHLIGMGGGAASAAPPDAP